MFEFLLQVFLGWPAMILSLSFALAGALFKKPNLLSAGAILLVPPAWYLGHYSIIFLTLPLFLIGSAYSISKGKMTRAFLLIIPVLIAISGLGILVLSQGDR